MHMRRSTMVRAADLWSCAYRVPSSNPPVFICVEKIGQNFSLRNASCHPAVMGRPTWWSPVDCAPNKLQNYRCVLKTAGRQLWSEENNDWCLIINSSFTFMRIEFGEWLSKNSKIKQNVSFNFDDGNMISMKISKIAIGDDGERFHYHYHYLWINTKQL